MRIQHKLAATAAALSLAAIAGTASANVSILGETATFTFNTSEAFGSGTFGTVLVEELSANQLKLTVDLNDPAYKFHDAPDANHPAFAFNLAGTPVLDDYEFLSPNGGTTVGLTRNGEFVDGGAGNAPPFGSFAYSLDYNRVPSGNNATPFAGPLVFTLTSASGLDISSFTANSVGGKSIYFTADLINEAGGTGNVGAVFTRSTTPTAAVPEPATWAMMLMGFAGLGSALRMRGRSSRKLQFTAA